MKHKPYLAAAGALVCLTGGTAHAQAGAGNSYYQLLNLTNSPGGTAFSVGSDVTFTDLSLTEVFSSGARFRVSLPQSSFGLDTGVIELDSALFSDPDPSYGAVTLATVNGIFDNGLGGGSGTDQNGNPIYQPGDVEEFDIANTFNGPTTPANVYADFTASLVNPDFTKPLNTVSIFAYDANTPGVTYAAGDFSLVTAIAPTPEPSSVTLLALGALGVGGLCAAARRRHAVSALSTTDEGEITCA